MPKLELNSALKGIRGMIDDWVYKRSDVGPVLTRKPTFTRPPTAAQVSQRERFAAAAAYAGTAMDDPVRRAVYADVARERGKPARAAGFAIADFFSQPEVTAIELAGYHGQLGATLTIGAVDDVALAAVRISIRDTATSTLVEEGLAIRGDRKWTYVTTTAAPAGAVLTVTATATDPAGNAGTKEVAVS